VDKNPSIQSLGWGLFWPSPENIAMVSLLSKDPSTKSSLVAVNYGRTAIQYVVDDADVMPLPRNADFASLSPRMGNA
jgi:hypothetical protein